MIWFSFHHSRLVALYSFSQSIDDSKQTRIWASSNFSWNGTTSRTTWSHRSNTCVTRRALPTWVANSRPSTIFLWKFLLFVSSSQVTLACDGQTCKAHKMVLSACSPYFKTLLEENPSKHPIIILKDVSFNHLQAILEFMWVKEFWVKKLYLFWMLLGMLVKWMSRKSNCLPSWRQPID